MASLTAKHRIYRELLASHKPRPITSNEEAEHIRTLLNQFLDRDDLAADEWDFVALLGDILSAWERKHYARMPVAVPEKIRGLLEAHGLPQKALVGPVFPTESVVSDVLHGRRHLSYDAVARLAEFFHVSPAVFYPGGQSSAD
jgi:HTH-type transcriptional regulator/antitoxin HigA